MNRISIITALHNKGPYVNETIASVQVQTHNDWELIVVENSSTDEGPERVETVARLDPRIRLIRAPESVRGPGAARNLGLEHAAGDWILFLDADDLIEPDYLSARIASAQPGTDVVAGPWKEFQDGSPNLVELRLPTGWRDSNPPIDAAFCFTPWILHATIVRRRHCKATGGWNTNLDHLPSEDCAFWFSQLVEARVAWCANSGALYRKGIPGSRDDLKADFDRIFEAGSANRQANVEYLAKVGHRPSPGQAATAVRVIRNLLASPGIPPALKTKATIELRQWLAMTNPFDPRMFCLRASFGVFAIAR